MTELTLVTGTTGVFGIGVLVEGADPVDGELAYERVRHRSGRFA